MADDGWDLHTQNQGLMRTDLTFRRVKPKTLGTYLSEFSAQGQAAFRRLEPQTHRRVLAVAGGLILLTVGIGIGAAIQGGDGIAEPTAPPSVAGVVPSEQPSVEPSDEPAEEVSEPSEEPSPDVMPPTTAAPTATESEWVELARFSGASKAYRTERPFSVDGAARVRYEFHFDSAGGSYFGRLNVYPARETGECVAAGSASTSKSLGDQEGLERLGILRGEFCGNFHPPDANWDRGTLTIVFEELR